jgi:integrase
MADGKSTTPRAIRVRPAKITKRMVDGIGPDLFSRRVWDGELRGFGVRVSRSGVACYFLKYRTEAGRQRWKRIGRVNELAPEEARKIARGILAAVAKGEDPGAVKITVRELAARFLAEHIEPKRKPSTLKNYTLVLNKHVVPKLGTLRADKVTTSDIDELHRSIGRKHKHQANRAVAIVSSMYRFAWRVAHVVPKRFNPAQEIELYPEEGRERFLDTAELARLGAAIREAETVGIPYYVDLSKPKSKHAPKNGRIVIGPFAAAAIRLLLFTGARLREILHLRWTDIDFENALIRLADHKTSRKTGKKTITLNAPALEILAGLQRASDYVIAGDDPTKPRSDLKRPWQAVRAHAGLADVRGHDLRHTHGSFGAGAGMSLPVIGALLGHASPASTKRYAHVHNDPRRQASERVAGDIAAGLGEGAPVATNNVRPMFERK